MEPVNKNIRRITLQRIGIDILDTFNLEKGLGYTLKMLAIRPDKAIREYLFHDRSRMMNPLRLLILIIGLAAFLSFYFLPIAQQLGDPTQLNLPDFLNTDKSKILVARFTVILKNYFNLFFFLSIPAISIATYFIFRKERWYFAEHLTMNAYLYSFYTIFYLFVLPFILKNPYIAFIQALLSYGYLGFAFTCIFKQTFWKGILKTIAVLWISQLIGLLLIAVLFMFLYLTL